MNKTAESGTASDRATKSKVRDFYERQVLENPELPAILGVPNRLAADLRDCQEWNTFRKLVPLDRSMNILELGCGGGRWCEHFAPVVEMVTGIDFSVNAIAHARKRVAGRIGNVNYHHASLEEFQPLEKYDLIYFSAVTPYMKNSVLEECIVKYAAALKGNGVIVVRDSVTNRAHELEHGDGYTACYRTIDEYRSCFGHVGFSLAMAEKAFPSFCLSQLLSNRTISRFYDAFPLFVRRALLALLSRLKAFDCNRTHGPGKPYSYDHLFLIFTRIY